MSPLEETIVGILLAVFAHQCLAKRSRKEGREDTSLWSGGLDENARFIHRQSVQTKDKPCHKATLQEIKVKPSEYKCQIFHAIGIRRHHWCGCW